MKTKILFILFIFFLASCSYFRVIPKSTTDLHSLEHFEKDGKYFILQRNDDAWHMYDLDVEGDMLQAKLNIQLGYHVNYLYPREDKQNQFYKNKEPDVINSIHLFTSDTSFYDLDTLISIPLSSIYEVKSYEYDRVASTRTKVLAAVLIPLTGGVIILVVAVAIALNSMEISFE